MIMKWETSWEEEEEREKKRTEVRPPKLKVQSAKLPNGDVGLANPQVSQLGLERALSPHFTLSSFEREQIFMDEIDSKMSKYSLEKAKIRLDGSNVLTTMLREARRIVIFVNV